MEIINKHFAKSFEARQGGSQSESWEWEEAEEGSQQLNLNGIAGLVPSCWYFYAFVLYVLPTYPQQKGTAHDR